MISGRLWRESLRRRWFKPCWLYRVRERMPNGQVRVLVVPAKRKSVSSPLRERARERVTVERASSSATA